MPNSKLSNKKILINKANSAVIIATASSAAIVIFCLIASKSLLSQSQYQNKVIKARKASSTKLKENVKNLDSLKKSYDSFNINSYKNIIGGDPNGTTPQDGNNAKIVLDSLPSSYDFPALVSSVEKILKDNNYTITQITGTDNTADLEKNSSAATPEVVEMPFTVEVKSNYELSKQLTNLFQASIRPFNFSKLVMAADKDGNIKTTIDAKTYYQPAKSLEIKSEVIK